MSIKDIMLYHIIIKRDSQIKDGHPMAESPRPLAGIKVAEFTHMVMGPTTGLILADLGAEVVKLEPGDGEELTSSERSAALASGAWAECDEIGSCPVPPCCVGARSSAEQASWRPAASCPLKSAS